MRAERSSTIGTERLTNYALQIRSRDEFIKQLTSNLPARPDYFLQDAEINRGGAPALSDMAELKAISPAELKALLEEGVIALDIRPGDQFAAGHVPGLDQHCAVRTICHLGGDHSWSVIPSRLIADSTEQLAEARLRLARVGIEAERGYLQGGVAGGRMPGLSLAQLPEITCTSCNSSLSENKIQVLDVRREPEWMAGHVAGAAWWPLDRFRVSPPEVDLDLPLAVHCQSGYRSMIACSLLAAGRFQKRDQCFRRICGLAGSAIAGRNRMLQ